ncbi:TetR/AcrR family transcriptional regulator [Veronia pacifica]|uniref:HTH tetR-type domain-containing protein n=1 Tax=Veronia pacifica TaxID=1080227 RepID=A0A1C3EBS3_9GAMM|nr:TetR/AcrR family transcriptional regulator [Veronia pacifica]ODA30650.1 hypothetical protein A8L45_19825 [Veronia pacifica]
MPWPKTRKRETREKILKSAIELFAQKGFHSVSLEDVLKNAELTRGAFYSHFKSKSELYREAVLAATDTAPLAEYADEDNLFLNKILSSYLSEEHVKHEVSPCPLAAFSTDTFSQSPDIKDAYSEVFEKLLEMLQKETDGEITDRQSAMSLAALMIGGVVVSRALSDDKLIQELLTACVSNAPLLLK